MALAISAIIECYFSVQIQGTLPAGRLHLSAVRWRQKSLRVPAVLLAHACLQPVLLFEFAASRRANLRSSEPVESEHSRRILVRHHLWALPHRVHRVLWALCVPLPLNSLYSAAANRALRAAHFSENWGFLSLSPLVGGNLFSIVFGRNLNAHEPGETTAAVAGGGPSASIFGGAQLLCRNARSHERSLLRRDPPQRACSVA